MTRKGYNSDWYWKRWTTERSAIINARKRNREPEADAAVDRAVQAVEQLKLELVEDITDARFGRLDQLEAD
jgi:hypothetical protein